jgi:MFS family permease
MTRLRLAGRQTFRSLSIRNFRIYFAGQIISGSGSWMQQVAQVWLVLQLTNSGVALGITTALQFLPVLLFGAWAGVLADRMDKRKLLIATSAAATVLAGTLGLLTAFDVVELWMVYVLAMLLGLVTAFDSPARRSFVTELVPEEFEANAVSLNSSVFTAARIVGPAMAGLVIAAFGIPVCFFLNSASFLAVIGAMVAMRRSEIRPARRATREKGQLVDGLRYVWGIPALRTTLLMTAVIGTLSFNFQVTLSLMAKKVFDGDAGTFGALYALMSVGALVGSLVVAHREKATSTFVVRSALLFGGLMLVAAAAPSLVTMAIVLVPMGAASIAFLSSAGALSQTRADPTYRGRVAALFAVAFLGSTPIGGPIVGAISEIFGARAGLVLGGITAVVTAVWGLSVLRRRAAERAAVPIAA